MSIRRTGSILGRMALGDAQAQLQLEEMKRDRDAIRLRALSDVVSRLTGGVVGGLQQFQDNQLKQEALKRDTEKYNLQMENLNRQREIDKLSMLSPGLSGLAARGVQGEFIEPDPISEMGPPAPREMGEDLAINQLIAEMKAAGLGNALTEQELRAQARGLYGQTRNELRRGALQHLGSRQAGLESEVQKVLEGEVPSAFDVDVSSGQLTNADPFSVARDRLRSDLLNDEELKGVLSEEEVDRYLDNIFYKQRKTYEEGKRRAAIAQQKEEREALAHRLKMEGQSLSNEQKRKELENYRAPGGYPDLDKAEKDYASIQKQIKDAESMLTKGIYGERAEERSKELENRIKRLNNQLRKKEGLVNKLRKKYSLPPLMEPEEEVVEKEEEEKEVPGLLSRTVDAIEYVVTGDPIENTADTARVDDALDKVAKLDINARSEVREEARRMADAGASEKEIVDMIDKKVREYNRSAAKASSEARNSIPKLGNRVY